MVSSLIAILILGAVARGNGQCEGEEMNLTSENGEISSPNNRYEYGRSANCLWEFTPADRYALVLTITYQRLYIIANGNKLCLGSYRLMINNDTQECTRYIDTRFPTTLIEPFEYFDFMCGEDAGNKQSVHVQYISDGRTYTGSGTMQTFGMGFRIQYKFLQCPTVTATIVETLRITAKSDPDTHTNPETTAIGNAHELITLKTNIGTFKTNTDRFSSGMDQTTLIILLSIPEFILVSIMIVAGIITTLRPCQHSTRDCSATVPDATEMGNISSAGQNGTSGADAYEEVQAAPSGGYEEILAATDGYEEVQIRATTQKHEAGHTATYANVA
uniref:uncharacterized protein LOC120332060 n=1 Tax=Styela clava TaxID=7725 RepID=UPI00193A343C|nr:uncharacterized protein LOC120332060 [Styela clava]